MVAWDNVNFSTSNYVEQRSGMPSKVQSGTFPVIYQLNGVNPTDLLLAPMLARAKEATPLNYVRDVRPSLSQFRSFQLQLKIHVIDILFAYVPEFSTYVSHPSLQRLRRRPCPERKTKYHPLRVSTIEEASTEGNIAVMQ